MVPLWGSSWFSDPIRQRSYNWLLQLPAVYLRLLLRCGWLGAALRLQAYVADPRRCPLMHTQWRRPGGTEQLYLAVEVLEALLKAGVILHQFLVVRAFALNLRSSLAGRLLHLPLDQRCKGPSILIKNWKHFPTVTPHDKLVFKNASQI